MDKKTEKKILNILFIVSALLFGYFFLLKLYRDYFIITSKEITNARILAIEESGSIDKPFRIKFSFNNKYAKEDIDCEIDVSGYFGKKLIEEQIEKAPIIYTKLSYCDVYFEGYNVPKFGYFILHGILLILIILVFISNLKQLLY